MDAALFSDQREEHEGLSEPLNKFSGGLNLFGAAPTFIMSETFHTPSLGDEEFEIPSINLESDVTLALEDVQTDFGELGDGRRSTALHSAGEIKDVGNATGSHCNSSSITIDIPLCEMSSSLLDQNQLNIADPEFCSPYMGLGVNFGTAFSCTRPSFGSLQAGGAQLQSSAPSYPVSLTNATMDQFQQKSVLVDPPVSLPDSSVIVTQLPAFSSSLHTPISSSCSSGMVRVGAELSLEAGVSLGVKKVKKARDPNEPQKPVSAYALFFRDTQAAIKGQNPAATFGEVSQIVASMWDSLGEEQKQVYKRKAEAAKKEYLKMLAAYRANHLSKPCVEDVPLSSYFPASACPVQPLHNTEQNSNVCISKVLLDLPAPALPAPGPHGAVSHPVTKIIFSEQMAGTPLQHLPTSLLTVIPSGSGSGFAAPLQQRPNVSKPVQLQSMVPVPPSHQTRPSGAVGVPLSLVATPLHPLQVKVLRAPLTSPGPAAGAAVTTTTAAAAAAALQVNLHNTTVEPQSETVSISAPPSSSCALTPSTCVRVGCSNAAVQSQDWDMEYCSNECVAQHCRDIFLAWCAIKSQNSTTIK